MKKKNNSWTFAYLEWVCGIIILYAFFVVDPDDKHDLILYNCLFSVICPLCFMMMTGIVKQVALILFFMITFIPSLLETGWFLIDQSVLVRTQFWVVFDTNPAEASGFLSMIQGWQWGALACYMAISVALFVMAMREKEGLTNYKVSLAACCIALMLIFIPGVRYNVPYINFYNSYKGYRMDVDRASKFMLSRSDLTGKVQDEFPDSTATIVVVIGESLSRTHCSLYGYCRQTNPRLERRNDMYVFQQVQAPDYMTQTVLQQVLSFGNKDDSEARWNEPTLPELLNAAGWHTYWYDPYEGKNNTANALPTGFSSIAKLSATYHLGGEDEQYDESHLSHLERALQDSISSRKAIFLHLIGNHFPYNLRYPQQFKYFGDEDICSPFVSRLTSQQKSVINSYDDAVRYNDWIIDSVLNRLNKEKYSCAMLYFPDHGEEVFDDDFYAGRSFNHVTRNLYEIPCVFWQNKAYTQCHPLHINLSTPYCTDDMIHSLLDIFGVGCAQKDTCRSLFHQAQNQ